MNDHVPTHSTSHPENSSLTLKDTEINFQTIPNYNYGLNLCIFMLLSYVFLSRRAKAVTDIFYTVG